MIKLTAQDIQAHSKGWDVIATAGKTQVAMMSLARGEVSGGYGTEHPNSDQVLFCLSGSGSAVVDGTTYDFDEGDLIIIQAGEEHQVKGGPCVTLNVYGPPAY